MSLNIPSVKKAKCSVIKKTDSRLEAALQLWCVSTLGSRKKVLLIDLQEHLKGGRAFTRNLSYNGISVIVCVSPSNAGRLFLSSVLMVMLGWMTKLHGIRCVICDLVAAFVTGLALVQPLVFEPLCARIKKHARPAKQTQLCWSYAANSGFVGNVLKVQFETSDLQHGGHHTV